MVEERGLVEGKMATEVRRIKLGSQGLEVSAQGLGCMGMAPPHGPPKPEEDMISVIRHAINVSVTHLDTSDVYGPHTNEILIGKALKEVPREKVQLASKFGCSFTPDGKMAVCGNPEYARESCEASLKRLDVDYIDLYYIHRVDSRIPFEITVLPDQMVQEMLQTLGIAMFCVNASPSEPPTKKEIVALLTEVKSTPEEWGKTSQPLIKQSATQS